MRGLVAICTCLALIGCSTSETTRLATPELSLPSMKTFTTTAVRAPMQSNAQIARDFLDLAFTLENGEKLYRFTRFEGPITVRVSGTPPATLSRDLDRLIDRLRREAKIPIRRVPADQNASITISAIKKSQIQSAAPSAACFVRPNVSSWQEYRARRNDPSTVWTNLESRARMAIFLPSDVSPQEIRDCLHEEISQALGPVNDLYRLTDSIFNDDNFHSVLTGFDMLILKAYYDPALQNGMREPEVAARLPGILARLNPKGAGTYGVGTSQASRIWQTEISTAMSPRVSKSRRRAAAQQAILKAKAFGPSDARLALSHYLYGRLMLETAPDTALAAFLQASNIYEKRPDTAIQNAHVAMQIAAFQLSAGRPDIALRTVDRNLKAVRTAEHAALLSLLLMVKAEALQIKGDTRAADEVQTEALGWARYGFGSDKEVRARAAEILAISPRTRTGAPA